MVFSAPEKKSEIEDQTKTRKDCNTVSSRFEERKISAPGEDVLNNSV